MSTPDPTRCLRPNCRFSPLPALTDEGGLKVFVYCSVACKELTEACLVIARSEPSTEVERQAQQLSLINDLLDLRVHPSEYDTWTGICGVNNAG